MNSTRRPDLFNVAAAVRQVDIRPRLRQGHGVAHAQALVGPGDDGRLPVQPEIVHRKVLNQLNIGHLNSSFTYASMTVAR